jgi:hypothetical protein
VPVLPEKISRSLTFAAISCCVAAGTTILSEHSPSASASSNASSLASLILPKISHSSAQKLTYTHGQQNVCIWFPSPTLFPFASISFPPFKPKFFFLMRIFSDSLYCDCLVGRAPLRSNISGHIAFNRDTQASLWLPSRDPKAIYIAVPSVSAR